MAAIRTEHRAANPGPMSHKRQDLAPGFDVPNAGRTVASGGYDPPAIDAEHSAVYLMSIALEGQHLAPGFGVPNAGRPVV